MDFALKLRAKRLPVLFEDETKIIFRPMLDNRFVDHTGFRVPQRYRMPPRISRTIRRIPSAPLPPGHRPVVTGADDVFHLTLMTDRKFDIPVDITLAWKFRAVRSEVGIVVFVDINQLETSKVHAIGARGPHCIEEIRI